MGICLYLGFQQFTKSPQKEVENSCINKNVSEYDQETMKQLAPIGQKLYEKLRKNRADIQTPYSLNEPVKKNMLLLFRLELNPDNRQLRISLTF